ncbi:hypothetical protein IWX85_002528 [Polaromonas sp. CG_9.11]|nr:hypothetical protein [Polaromonas sp. CG_9.11]
MLKPIKQITPNIIQTIKQKVNASVLTISTDQAFLELFSSDAMLFCWDMA